MLEYWKNGLEAHDFSVWIKGFGINSFEFSMEVLILQGGRMETEYSIIPTFHYSNSGAEFNYVE